MTFDEAFTALLGHEGGYVANPKDPGGETNWGVIKKVAEAHGYHGDMRDFTQDAAKDIYRASYWNQIRAETLPEAVRYAAFDAAVNSGVSRANDWLKIAMEGTTDEYRILAKFIGLRLRFMTDLKTWETFGKGWSRRLAAILTA